MGGNTRRFRERFANYVDAQIALQKLSKLKQRPYKNPLALQSNIDKQINDMLDAGIVSLSRSPWSSPMVIVPKRKQRWYTSNMYRL